MMFVDGENLTIRGQRVAEDRGVAIPGDGYWRKDVFLWRDGWVPRQNRSWGGIWDAMSAVATRAHYYTSAVGDDDMLRKVREQLWNVGFHAEVFKKTGAVKSKGVDISLTKDMLAHAFLDNYDLALLVSGDGDYVPLVSEVMRRGKMVSVAAFESGLNPALRLAADHFIDLTEFFVQHWSDAKR